MDRLLLIWTVQSWITAFPEFHNYSIMHDSTLDHYSVQLFAVGLFSWMLVHVGRFSLLGAMCCQGVVRFATAAHPALVVLHCPPVDCSETRGETSFHLTVIIGNFFKSSTKADLPQCACRHSATTEAHHTETWQQPQSFTQSHSYGFVLCFSLSEITEDLILI